MEPNHSIITIHDIERDINNTLEYAEAIDASISPVAIQTWLGQIHQVGRKNNNWILDKINYWIKWNLPNLTQQWITFLLLVMAHVSYQEEELMARTAHRLITEYDMLSLRDTVTALISFAKLGYYNKELYDTLIYHALTFSLGPHDIPKLFKAMALVDTIHHDLVTTMIKSINAKMQFTVQQAIEIMWSMAVLEIRHITVYKHLIKFTIGKSLSSGMRLMLYQTYLWLYYTIHVKIPMPSVNLHHKKYHKFDPKPSKEQAEIGRCLSILGYNFINEGHIRYISVDIIIPRLQIAIEFNGPSHYLFRSRRPTGKTRMKQRNIISVGWRLVTIGYFDWPDNFDEQLVMIRGLIE